MRRTGWCRDKSKSLSRFTSGKSVPALCGVIALTRWPLEDCHVIEDRISIVIKAPRRWCTTQGVGRGGLC
jgi:hypothetical protein